MAIVGTPINCRTLVLRLNPQSETLMVQNLLSRRKALQFFSSAPLLPLGTAFSATGLLAACGGGSDTGSSGNTGSPEEPTEPGKPTPEPAPQLKCAP